MDRKKIRIGNIKLRKTLRIVFILLAVISSVVLFMILDNFVFAENSNVNQLIIIFFSSLIGAFVAFSFSPPETPEGEHILEGIEDVIFH